MPEKKAKPLVVALTGGIAAGKTLVSDAFSKHGVPVIDADIIARDVVRPGSDGLNALIDAFGVGILTAEGHLDRTAMRRRVFSNPEELATLNAIVHPLIGARMQYMAAIADAPYVLAVIPLLCEGAPKDWIDRILVVHADTRLRTQRLLQRDGIDAPLAKSMLATQCSDEQRLQLADDIILNHGSRDDVHHRVAQLHGFYTQLAQHHHSITP